jgi:hypothetical protein
MEKEQLQNLESEQVVIFTEKELIEGTFYHNKNMRLSDALNSPSHRDIPYLPLADARVTMLETGEERLQSRFLLVAHNKIVVMMPRPEILSCAVIRRWMDSATPGLAR